MSRTVLIHAVFNATPRPYRGITTAGQHRVKLNTQSTIVDYAILENLSLQSLEGLAKTLAIAV